MRPICFFLPISILLPLLTFAQQINKHLKARDSIIIDFKHDTSLYLWKLKYNTPYVVKLKNINRFAYKDANATQTGMDFNTEVPSALQGVKLPGFLTPSDKKPQNAAKELEHNRGNLTKSKNVKKEDTCLKICPCPTVADYTSLKLSFKNSFIFLQKNDSEFKNLSELIRKLELLQKNVTDSFPIITQKKETLLSEYHIAYPYSDSSIRVYYEDLLKKSLDEQKKLNSTASRITDMLDSTLQKSCLSDTTRLLRCLLCKTCKNANYKRILLSLDSSRKCAQQFELNINSIDKIVSKVKEAVEAMNKLKQDGKIDVAQNDYNILSEQNFSLTVDEFLAKNDVHEVVFTANAADPQPSNQLQKRTIKLTGITTGGMKVDFSIGALINFGSDEFLGPQYYYVTVNDSTKQIQQTVHANKAMLSVGALMHVYWRLYSWVKPALSWGVSTTTGFDQVNFHLGLSAIIGKPGTKNRLIISTGATLKESSILDSRYQLTTPYKGLPDDVPVSKTFPKSGWFFALTYNFTAGKN
jgi:hypothetical protein